MKRHRKSSKKKSRSRSSQKKYIGTVQKNPRGFAFLLPENADIEDVYVERSQATALFSKDKVEFVLLRRKGRLSAKILRVVERGQKKLLGIVETYRRKLYLSTHDGSLQIAVSGKNRPKDGQWVLADIVRYPSRTDPGQVRVEKNLGSELEPEHDLLVAQSRFGLEERFPKAAIDEANRVAETDALSPRLLKQRKDLRNIPLVTIDGEDAKDFDDAVAVVEEDNHKHLALYVAIADVSYYVRTGTVLDQSAYDRATSVYFPGYCLPMLPETLSNGQCSLRPKEPRLALTAKLIYNRQGKFLRSEFMESVIQTHARLTYTQVQSFLDGDKKTRQRFSELKEPIERMYQLFLKLREQRERRGALDFELPESQISVDERGMPTASAPAQRWESHKLIEEFMIAANEAVARELRTRNIPSVYRVHESPEAEAVDEINSMMKSLGIQYQMRSSKPLDFAKALDATSKSRAKQTVHQLILRTQKQACYEAKPKGHFGLALTDYTHFTSPIRRYPDLLVHRSLKALIHRSQKGLSKKESLEKMASHCSDRERNAMDAERFVKKRKQCWFMLNYLDAEYDGRVASITELGLYVEIPKFAIEGLLPPSQMHGFYEFDEVEMCLYKRPGNERLRVGDGIRIRVDDVIVEENKILFAQVKSRPKK